MGTQWLYIPPKPMWPMLIAIGPEKLVHDTFALILQVLMERSADYRKVLKASLHLAEMTGGHDELWLAKWKLLVTTLLQADEQGLRHLDDQYRHRQTNSQPLGPLFILGGEDDGPCPVCR